MVTAHTAAAGHSAQALRAVVAVVVLDAMSEDVFVCSDAGELAVPCFAWTSLHNHK